LEPGTQSRIVVREVSKRFRLGENSMKALDHVSLEIGPGLTALVGPSGSGKSTLLNLIGALDSPDIGEIVINGTLINQLSQVEKARFRNQHCGFVFQNFNLIPVLSARENVCLPAQLSREGGSAKANERAYQLLERVGLKEQADQPVNRLSGGQMQRVAIARALMNDPDVILADEPTANLDQKTAASIMSLLKALADEQKKCLVIATHDQSVLSYCSTIVLLRDGKLV
jgi:putative ABC transport system ATP-binding protein